MTKNGLPIHADDLRAMGEDLETLLAQLPPHKAEELIYTWEFWARPQQIAPTGDWNTWFINAGRGFGKLLRKDEDILTHNRGWTTIGDLVEGDFIYDEMGTPRKVKGFYESDPSIVYELEFDSGEKIQACGDHLWTTETHYRDRKRRKGILPDDWALDQGKVKTTQQIVDTFTHGSRGDLNHSIPCAKPFSGVVTELPLDPYILGLWLGDGHKNSGCLTNNDQDIWNKVAESFALRFYTNLTANAKGLFPILKGMGLLFNKHIPEQYLLADIESRKELLRGLMDSDGYIDPDNGSAEFCQNDSNPLAKQVLELVNGLGMKARMYSGRATLNGCDCGEKFRVVWTVRDFNPFWLPRKAVVAEKYLNKTTGQVNRNRQRMLKSFKVVPKPDCGMRCITVDGPSNLFLVGRSFIPTHNTRAGVEWVRSKVKEGHKRIAAIAPTNGDVDRVMVNGESGFLARCWKGDKTHAGVHMGYPNWSPTKRLLTWENGAYVQFFSAEEAERLRGPQFSCAWADELAAWHRDRDTWDMLQFTLRLGKHPQVCVTTTPKPTKLVRDILKNPKTVVTNGSTFDNSANLASTYLEAVKSQYEGTRLGRQELYAEILDEASGALWTRQLLATCEVEVDDPLEFSQTLSRVVVAVDPAVSANSESDMTGIVVAGIDVNGICYILQDATDRYTPEGWAAKAIELYNLYGADRIVAERNQGGEMVRYTFKSVDETIPIKLVHASRGKFARAEPVSALYERGRVKHVKGLDALEDQMVQWEPLGSIGSPDRLDAMVWAVTELALKGIARPELNLAYSDAKGLSTRL